MKNKVLIVLSVGVIVAVLMSAVPMSTTSVSRTVIAAEQPGIDTQIPASTYEATVDKKKVSNTRLETLGNPLNADSIEELLLGLVDIAIYIGTIIAILMIIYTGFMYIMARGNPTKIADVHRLFMYVVIGIAILLGSKVIVEIIKNTFISAGVVDGSLFKK